MQAGGSQASSEPGVPSPVRCRGPNKGVRKKSILSCGWRADDRISSSGKEYRRYISDTGRTAGSVQAAWQMHDNPTSRRKDAVLPPGWTREEGAAASSTSKSSGMRLHGPDGARANSIKGAWRMYTGEEGGVGEGGDGDEARPRALALPQAWGRGHSQGRGHGCGHGWSPGRGRGRGRESGRGRAQGPSPEREGVEELENESEAGAGVEAKAQRGNGWVREEGEWGGEAVAGEGTEAEGGEEEEEDVMDEEDKEAAEIAAEEAAIGDDDRLLIACLQKVRRYV